MTSQINDQTAAPQDANLHLANKTGSAVAPQPLATGDSSQSDGNASSGFDYSRLDGWLAATAREIASRIRLRHRRQIEGVIETGQDLLEVKVHLRHGDFGDWIAAEFGMSRRTAQNYMGAAQCFAGKCATISHLPLTCVYALASASVPQRVRDKVIRSERPIPMEVVRALIVDERLRQRGEKERLRVIRRRALAPRRKRAQQSDIERAAEAQHRANVQTAEILSQACPDALPELIKLIGQGNLLGLLGELRRVAKISR